MQAERGEQEEEGGLYIVSRACKTGQDGLAKKEEWAGSVRML